MNLRTSIILLVVILTLGTGLGSSLLARRMASRSLEDALLDQGSVAARVLATRLSSTVREGKHEEADRVLVETIKRNPTIEFAYIVGFDNRIFAQASRNGWPELSAAEEHHHLPASVHSPEFSHSGRTGNFLEVSCLLAENRPAHLHLGLDEEPMYAQIRTLNRRILGWTLLLTSIGIASGIFLSRRMTKPLADLATELLDMSRSGTARKIVFRGRGRDLANLFEAFNRLLADRRKTDKALRESEERIRATFNSISDPVFLHPLLEEGFGFFSEVNSTACRRYGYTREEFLNLKATDISKREDAEAHASRQSRRFLREAHRNIFEAVHITKSGQEFPVEINSTVIELGGKPYILSVARDITDRKQAEQEREDLQARLNQAQKMESIGRLAGGVAHDFNNMLSVIMGHLELAMEQVDQELPVYADLQQIHKASVKSSHFTRQLLAFARKQTIAPEVLDLNQSIEDMLQMLQRLVGEDIELNWTPGTDIWPIELDPSQLDQILANLCANARDAIQDVGRITIETGNITIGEDHCTGRPEMRPGDFVLLAVSDDGRGLDPEIMGQLFEPFFTTKAMGQGTGLGLATIYGIIKQNDGFINVYSEPGQGTTFRIYLPRHLGQVAPARTPDQAGPVPGGQETILIVEDNATILDMAARMLQQRNYKVLAAASPAEAMQLAAQHDDSIHLLLTDVIMPGMNGRDLAENLEASCPGIKCLYMSGYTSNVITNRGVLDRGVHFIQKPFSIRELARKVREALDS